MRTEEIKIYTFNELSEEIKQEVLEKLAYVNVEDDWWEAVYEDATNIGLKLTGFGLGRGNYCNGKFIESSITVANNILSGDYMHGDMCSSHKAATVFLNTLRAFNESIEEGEEEPDTTDIEAEFLDDLLEYYKQMLKDEQEYKISEEAIIETIEANEWEFTEDGKRY